MRGGWLVGVVLLLGCGGKDADGGGGAAGAGASGTGATGGTGGLGGIDTSGGGGAAPSGGASGSGGGPSAGVGPSTGGNANPPSDPRTCAEAPPDWVFCSDFEEGNKDVWDDYDGNPDETNLLMADGGPFDLADNHVMRLRAPAGRGGADLVKVLPDTYDRLYARWYISYEPGFDFSAPNHGGGLHAGSRDLLGRSDYRPDGTDWFTAWVEHTTDTHVHNLYSYYRGMYMDCVDPNGACWGDHFPCMLDEGEAYCERPEHRETVTPPTLETGRWYCVELLVDGGTPMSSEAGADGVFDFWIDGQEIGPWDDLWLRATPDLRLSILWLNLFHHQEHSVEGVLFDDVAVSTAPIGCR
ncbi:MAG TPA: hypothetical protein PLU22_03095 [Polyangiaceae bacterium]|nr:hypothetical protein [Polyangiaceae bacterium]